MLLTRRRWWWPAVALMLVAAGCSSSLAGQPLRDATAVVTSSSTGSGAGTTSVPPQITDPTTSGSGSMTTDPPPTSGGAGNRVDGAVGTPGIGDPYYPMSGNGGYQIDNYNLTVHYDPATDQLSGLAKIVGTVTETSKLGRFDLDLQPTMVVASVDVNGQPASFQHTGAELVITPAAGLAPATSLSMIITYAGKPDKISGGTANLGDGGWYRTPSGGALAIGEPFSASAWFPVNEHPADTASYSIAVTVPKKWKVISNGIDKSSTLPAAPAGQVSYLWVQRQPIASYLTTLYIDTFTTVVDKLPDGTPIISAFAPVTDAAKYKKLALDTKAIVVDLEKHFGPYPFDAAGGIYTGEPIQFALETTTRPVYADWVDTETIVHELAHQWYGDYVAVERWADICLNECFASYAPWLWYQDTEGADLDSEWVQEMTQYQNDPSFWSSPLVDMGAGNEFTAVYTRGPLALHALRREIGDATFAKMLLEWPKLNGGKNVTFDQWEAYVTKLAGKDLTGFIDAWFRARVVPPAQYLHPGGLGS